MINETISSNRSLWSPFFRSDLWIFLINLSQPCNAAFKKSLHKVFPIFLLNILVIPKDVLTKEMATRQLHEKLTAGFTFGGPWPWNGRFGKRLARTCSSTKPKQRRCLMVSEVNRLHTASPRWYSWTCVCVFLFRLGTARSVVFFLGGVASWWKRR